MATPFAGTAIYIVDNAGLPVNGAQIFTYAAGTLTPKAVYTTSALTVAHQNPIIASGGHAVFYLGAGSYRIRVYNSVANGGAELTQYADDNISGDAATVFAASLADTSSAAAGDALVGVKASGTGAVARTAHDKFADTVDARDYDTLANAIAAASCVVIASSVAVAADTTLPAGKELLFLAGGSLTIASGKVLTVAGDVTAPERQIFYGAGTVANLARANLAWFAGDNINTATDSLALIQAAYNATRNNGEVTWPIGSFSITGATAIVVSKGQKTVGSGKFASRLNWVGPACNGFSVTTTIGASFNQIGMGLTSNTVLPTSGVAIKAGKEYVEISNVLISGCYEGIEYPVSSGNGKATQFDVLDAKNIGIHVHDVNDVWFDQFFVVAIAKRVVLSAATAYVANELLTASGGATGQIIEIVSSTIIRVQFFNTTPAAAETLTGTTSAATGTISSVATGHANGGIRLMNKAEAINFTDGDVIGGAYVLATDAAANTTGVRPAYCKFTAVYFDSADSGASLNNSVELAFNDCWFSSRPGNGMVINTADGVRFTGGGAVNCAQHGVLVQAGAKRVTFGGGFTARGNSTLTANTYSGIIIASNTTDFSVQGCVLGGSLSFGSQKYGCEIAAGTSDRYILADNLVTGNTTAGITDGGSGANKRVANNY